MNPNIGDNIRRLRKEQDVSQERLAQYLNVSHQAVSKWESGDVFPDITLLPKLANIFGISIDKLFGIGNEPPVEKINKITDKAAILSTGHKYIEAEEVLRAGLDLYPNSYVLMIQLATVLRNRYKDDSLKDKLLLEESIEKCKTVLSECKDDELRYKAHRGIAITYAMLGHGRQAAEEAKKIPVTDDIMLYILAGDERLIRCQQDIFIHIKKTASLLTHMADLSRQKGKQDDALYYIDLADRMLGSVFENSDYLDMMETKNIIYMEYAKVYATTKHYKKCIDCLKKCIGLVTESNSPVHTKYTSRTFNMLESTFNEEYYSAIKNQIKVVLQDPIFDMVKKMPEFMDIQNSL